MLNKIKKNNKREIKLGTKNGLKKDQQLSKFYIYIQKLNFKV